MAQDTSALATKEDIRLVMERMGELELKFERKVDESQEEMIAKMHVWKAETAAWVQLEAKKTKQYFDVVAENLRYDLVGIYKDRTEDHEQRIKRLERKTGLAV